MNRFLNIRYIILQSAYWGTFCVFGAFATLYLGSRGMSASGIGVLLAVSSAATALCQPIIAEKADRGGRFSLKELTVLGGAVTLAASIILLLTDQNTHLTAIIYCLGFASLQVIQPLVTSIGMYYVNRGDALNYGLARGIGSGAYACTSAMIGVLAASLGPDIVPTAAGILGLIIMLLASGFRIERVAGDHIPGRDDESGDVPGSGNRTNKPIESAAPSDTGYALLLQKNPKFILFLVSVVLLFTFHFMTNTYLYQIIQNVGGDSAQLGMATSIAAVCELPVMFGFSWIVKRIPIKKLLRMAALFWVVKALTICICSSVTGIYVNQILQCAAYGLYIPSGVYYANALMTEQNKVKGQAMLTIAFTLGSLMGNLLGGILIDMTGVSVMLRVAAGLTMLGAVIMFTGTKSQI